MSSTGMNWKGELPSTKFAYNFVICCSCPYFKIALFSS
jgi:hypothetical protein